MLSSDGYNLIRTNLDQLADGGSANLGRWLVKSHALLSDLTNCLLRLAVSSTKEDNTLMAMT
jgi:hypothetical protein